MVKTWLLLAGLALLAGCGGTASPAASAAPTPAPTPQVVMMNETEFAITPATLSLKPGSYVFRAVNAGKFPHDLHVFDSSNQEVGATTKTLAPGDSADVQVTLKAGSYSFFCAVDSHKDRGMKGTITVS